MKKTSTLRAAVPLSKLTVDPTYQRELDESFVRRTVKQYDPMAVGVINVAKRADGTLVILDGQHRVNIVRSVMNGRGSIDCKVVEGLTLADEAELFVRLNQDKPMSTFAKYRAKSNYDPETQAINAIVEKVGLRVADKSGNTKGEVYAIAAAETVYRKMGATILEATLWVLKESWDNASGSYQRPLIMAVASMFKAHGEDVDPARLAVQLSKQTTSPQGLVKRIAEYAQAVSGKAANRHMDVAGREILKQIYNEGRRKGNL